MCLNVPEGPQSFTDLVYIIQIITHYQTACIMTLKDLSQFGT